MAQLAAGNLGTMGEGSFLPEKQTNKKLALWLLRRMCSPREGPHLWVTTDMSLPFPCWTSTNKMRDKFPSPLTFSRNCPLTQFLICLLPPPRATKTIWQIKDAARGVCLLRQMLHRTGAWTLVVEVSAVGLACHWICERLSGLLCKGCAVW